MPNKKTINMKKVVCFGEILWDVLIDGKKPGGAPMNVAYHLNRLGMESYMVSKVGNDPLGDELRGFLKRMGLSTQYIQVDDVNSTSEVIATMGENHEMNYEIIQPVAWDFIKYNTETASLIESADLMVFGSLVARNEATRKTLYELIDHAKLKLFDVNFRAPHYTKSTIDYLLKKADIVKLNNHELQIIGEWLGEKTGREQEGVTLLQEKYQIEEIIVTKGGDGASYYTVTERHDYKAYPVTIRDTVGSGDSFLAAFVAQKLKGQSIDDTLDYAAALGAYVTSQSGANPDYKASDLDRFIWEKQLERVKWK